MLNTCRNQQVVNEMVSKSLRGLTGKSSDAAARDVIFHEFNKNHARGDIWYQPGGLRRELCGLSGEIAARP